MLSGKREYQYMDTPEIVWDVAANLPETEKSIADTMTRFHGQFADCMEMYACAATVAEYFNSHREWFYRCAVPMKVEPIGETGYALTIGRFGSFGYDVEPKVGLELLPPDEGIYQIKTIAVPDYVPPGYDVDFKAQMQLLEQPASSETEFTLVEWHLDLSVDIHFPKFIQRLPKSVVQNTGDRLLNQIVRQVSRRLTHKVQEDFHKSYGLPFPQKSKEKRAKC